MCDFETLESASETMTSCSETVSYTHLNGDLFPPHSQRHQLHGKGFAGTARAKDRDIGVLTDRRIEDVHDNEGTIVLVDAQQDTVIITHLRGDV